MIPIYGFLEGDTLGLLLLAKGEDTVAELAAHLQSAAGVRVAPRKSVAVVHRGHVLAPELSLEAAGITALDRIDVVEAIDGV